LTFLNAILLAGAAAFLIPLIIHLLNKRRVQTVRWGAMHLLQEVLRQRKRKLKIEQWLLLAVRIAIPIVLALCLARPVLTALRSLGLGKTSLVVMLDDSFSMRAPAAGGTVAQQARQDIGQIIENLPRGSDAQIVLAGGTPRRLMDQATTALDLIPKQLAENASQAGPVRLNDALQSGIAALSRAASAAREIAIVSDFQASDWQVIADGAALPALDALAKQEPRPQVTFYRVTGDLTENLAIAGADLSATVVAGGQPVGLRVRVQNHGKRPWQDVAVHLEADGSRLRTSRVSLPADGEAVIGFTHAFDSTGDHSLAVRIEGDSFADDNAFYSIVQVRDRLNVLLVDGDPSNDVLEGAADFLELALTPHQSAAAAGLKDLISITKVDARRLRDEDLRGKEVIVLADVDRLQGNRYSELEKLVKAGAGMIVFAGPHCDVDWYNRDFFRKGEGMYPAAIKGFQRSDSPTNPARVLQQRLTHPALIYFNDARGGRLQDAEFHHWFQFEMNPQSKPVLQLDRGTPLFVERAYGRGRVIAAATTADTEWSNLPLQVFFVPLMQRLVTYLATQSTGNAWELTGNPLRLTLPKEQIDTEFTLRDPTGLSETFKAKREGEAASATSKPILQPGIYTLNRQAGTRRLAYNLDSAESGIAPLSAEKVKAIAERYQASFVESFDAYSKLDRTRRHGSELWQPFLIAVLALLFFEVLLQQRIARG